jgi:hypothetical protein
MNDVVGAKREPRSRLQMRVTIGGKRLYGRHFRVASKPLDVSLHDTSVLLIESDWLEHLSRRGTGRAPPQGSYEPERLSVEIAPKSMSPPP